MPAPFGIFEKGIPPAQIVLDLADSLAIPEYRSIGQNAGQEWNLANSEATYKAQIAHLAAHVGYVYIEGDTNECLSLALYGTPAEKAIALPKIDKFQLWTKETSPGSTIIVNQFPNVHNETLTYDQWLAAHNGVVDHLASRTVEGTPLPAMCAGPQGFYRANSQWLPWFVETCDYCEDKSLETHVFLGTGKLVWDPPIFIIPAMVSECQIVANLINSYGFGFGFWKHNVSPPTHPIFGQYEIFIAYLLIAGYLQNDIENDASWSTRNTYARQLIDSQRNIQQRFKELVVDAVLTDLDESLPTQWDNDPKQLPDKGLCCRFAVKYGERRQVSIGSNIKRFRRVGAGIAQFFDDAGNGIANLAHLTSYTERVWKVGTDSGIRYKAPETINVGRTGSRWQMNVVCPFTADDFES